MAALKIKNTLDSIPLRADQITYLNQRNGRLSTAEQRTAQTRAALMSTKRGWVLFDFTGYETYVNGLRVADCMLIRENDQLQIGGVNVELSFDLRREKCSPVPACCSRLRASSPSATTTASRSAWARRPSIAPLAARRTMQIAGRSRTKNA